MFAESVILTNNFAFETNEPNKTERIHATPFQWQVFVWPHFLHIISQCHQQWNFHALLIVHKEKCDKQIGANKRN